MFIVVGISICDLDAISMENGNGYGGAGGGGMNNITADDVMSKLKDDGDFDRLRLKIIRKLKENEELRSSIVSVVKQSAALNRPGAENMKPRQLSDAIHQEVGGKLSTKISDSLWEIIRSSDGMNSEITETVKSVYSKLSRPRGDENGESSHHEAKRIRKGFDRYKSNTSSIHEADGLSDSEPKEPPGFSRTDAYQIDVSSEQAIEDVGEPMHLHALRMVGQHEEVLQQSREELGKDAVEPSSPPGFSSGIEHKQPCDDSDEDLDAPPGFGS